MFRRVLGKTLGFVGYTIQYGCIAHCAFEYIGEIVVCSGPSMEPTIVNKDVVFSERMTRHLCKIQKGDIVIAKSLFDPNMNVCKRVIGLEGDKVYMSGPSNLFKTQTYVPKGHVWLEGDNLGNSTDSRSYGPVPYALIRGRVCLKTVRLKQTVCPTDTTMHLFLDLHQRAEGVRRHSCKTQMPGSKVRLAPVRSGGGRRRRLRPPSLLTALLPGLMGNCAPCGLHLAPCFSY
ncbi:mitochondrial inner membrane protease subunit 1 isoform X6 [Syngnathoides biaculeatus]|uniref:mitochondrial inner membrane protease subunit 1 isoform X6 n=1 Tax=Syngnathoides biaculeatus TaxID=300417 RepID=UPI002ADD3216|nr:mitochondrial inner membrane protease subunit 1 isoform X6 [Syngnathoides biaculeatus]